MAKLSHDDWQAFRDAVRDVTPLAAETRRPTPRRRPPALARFARADAAAALAESLHGKVDPADLETGDELVFARPGLGRKELRRLRRGQFSVEAELDLHGLRSSEAKQALAAFLAECRERRLRCVRVVHGKGRGSGHGGPVLKPKVARWLSRREEVLGFASARSVDGGTGAVYVLLARR